MNKPHLSTRFSLHERRNISIFAAINRGVRKRMGRRQGIAYLLLAACMVMLTASVFPHHHHDAAIYLLHEDETCSAVSQCHTDECAHEFHLSFHHKQSEQCADDCVTKFHCPTPRPKEVASPSFMFVIVLYSSCNLLKAHFFEKEEKTQCAPYNESLYSVTTLRTDGLRAPPSVTNVCRNYQEV